MISSKRDTLLQKKTNTTENNQDPLDTQNSPDVHISLLQAIKLL